MNLGGHCRLTLSSIFSSFRYIVTFNKELDRLTKK